MSNLITIVTTPERAEIIRLSLAHHAAGIRPWAEMPDEPQARAALAQVQGAQADVAHAILAQREPLASVRT